MVDQLRQLIRQYSSGGINYGDFRNRFVRFMSASDEDAVIERLYNDIESLCSAYEHNHINDVGLKLKLQQIAPVAVIAQQNAAAVVSQIVLYVPRSAVGVQPMAAGNRAISISSVASNSSVQPEPELEAIV